MVEAKAISQLVAFEMDARGGRYCCNDVRPGGPHAAPLGCCRSRSLTLGQLLRHLEVQPSFVDTLRRALRAALADDATERDSVRLKPAGGPDDDGHASRRRLGRYGAA